MWKTVGTLNPNDNKQNRSKQQANCQPFGQASRLRLNQSQLSGQKSHQFMNEYFTKRRSPESSLHRVMSQKAIEVREGTSPTASLKQLQFPKTFNKAQVSLDDCSVQQGSLKELQRSIERQKGMVFLRGKCQKIKESLKLIRQQQAKISKSMADQVEAFKRELKRVQGELASKIDRMQKNQTDQEKIVFQNVNPQLLSKIKREGVRFNEKMEDLDTRREQIKARYKDKYVLNQSSDKYKILSQL